MKEFYTHGSEAYAPIPVTAPSHLPDDPKKPEAVSETKGTISLTSAVGAVVILALFIGLLVSMVGIFEARSERAALQRRVDELKTEQDRLRTQYESSIDMDAVAKRAEELGMHIPWAEQIQTLDPDSAE